MSNIFVRSWKGQESLAKAFWLIAVLFSIILGIIISFIYSYFQPDMVNPNLMVAIQFPYTLYATVCVWRCAKNSAPLWRFLARLLVILSVIGGITAIAAVV